MVQFINTLSLTASVNDWLVNSHHPRILHVFDKVCNLINEHQEVLSIVTQQIGNGPFNLLIKEEVSFSEHLNAESPISIYDNQLILGNLTINCAEAKLWSPRPDWEKLHVNRNSIRIQLTSLPITNYQPLLSDSLISNFSTALVKADISSVKNITSQLAGLGPGLTPAGDDFILGAIYAAWIIHPFQTARLLAEAITNTAAPLTTSLSAAWLRSAGRGEVGSLWHEFFQALIHTDRVRIQKAMDKIFAVGATSGADAMAGFIGLFIYGGEHWSNLWEYNQT
jgi:Protein of unknown function (DUF2877)